MIFDCAERPFPSSNSWLAPDSRPSACADGLAAPSHPIFNDTVSIESNSVIGHVGVVS